MARRLRVTLHALCKASGKSTTVADFVNQPEKRTDVTMRALFSVITTASHEFVLTPRGVDDDLATGLIRTEGDLLAYVKRLPTMTGKTLTALSKEAGVSLSLLTWANKGLPSSVYLHTVLAVLDAANINVKLRRIGDVKQVAPVRP